jgi:hypothetical protein
MTNSDVAADSDRPAGGRSVGNQSSPSDASTGVAILRLTRRASLLLAFLLSLGLWAGIWTAVASLASAILG